MRLIIIKGYNGMAQEELRALSGWRIVGLWDWSEGITRSRSKELKDKSKLFFCADSKVGIF